MQRAAQGIHGQGVRILAQVQECIDKEAIPLRRGHATGGALLQVGQGIADARRAERQTGLFAQGLRAHGLSVANVQCYERAQQSFGPIGQLIAHGLGVSNTYRRF